MDAKFEAGGLVDQAERIAKQYGRPECVNDLMLAIVEMVTEHRTKVHESWREEVEKLAARL